LSAVIKREQYLGLSRPRTVFFDLLEFLGSLKGKKLSVSIGIKTTAHSRPLALHIPLVFVKKKCCFKFFKV